MIEHNADIRILKDLKQIVDKAPAHRCLYLRFSQTHIEKDKWLPILTEVLKGKFFDEVAQIYICNDDDVFILGRSWTHKRLEQFLTHVNPKFSPASLLGLASLFEIGVDWPRLRTLCNAKIKSLKILQEKANVKKTEKLEAVSRKEALTKLNSDLISSLAMRREMRHEIEIMVVEDDPFSQRLVASALKKYNVTMTDDGQGAIMTYVNKAPDILFLDIGLPDIDGHEVLQKIFEIDPQAYVVMFSGNGDKENIMKAIKTGAHGFVGKPFTKEKLHQYIEKSPFVQSKHKETA